ncbi:MAG: CopG family transcriptional regulator [Cytophagales bacterium]|nr:CopG family transcriptional regulator [Cytophagales bacterium]
MKKSNKKNISAKDLDKKFDNCEDISDYMDFDKAIVVKKINLDMPQWIIDILDKEAMKLNVSKEIIIKMWLSEKIEKIYHIKQKV